MASGFFALFDDIAVLAKTAALSADDIVMGAAKASAKSAGVIIDDAAVTPQYVRGLSPKRELPIVWRITKGSLINKFAFVIPALLLLSWLLPWSLPWLLIAGGSYLVYEGAIKVLSWFGVNLHAHHSDEEDNKEDAKTKEDRMVKSATTTDLVLSAEIMLISMSNIDTSNIFMLIGMLCLVALGMTVMVYGSVALLVKLDDIGLHIATNKRVPDFGRRMGLGLAKGMPAVFNVIGTIGTVAMLWVGGHLLAKSASDVGFPYLYDFVHYVTHFVEPAGGFVMWTTDTLISAILGLIVGLVYSVLWVGVQKVFKKNPKH